ncbi:MAG: HAMP domain-containing histidine kinase [Bacteroidia bacterium]|uniref:histidine kinase n=1 Tax=Lentimicrobium saccharophilum TaxID=1678841 RepID=A0A0S7BSH0_9BACT|nr:HAMP domain-containing sensor histidine kinase [Lentimicrobium saccharophilum]MDD3479897.1 HAMP domain-containing sensor histidine kinase [Paludibacteraceae bacterium]NCD41079.1 HAMP domain-containing histidine kinase [Bacteroidia bacterium]GAP43373.1 signal transduction histidine kinase [Lentimicrobium saccharophilum]
MTKKLLNTTSKSYLLFTIILIVIAAPAFYYVIQNLYLEDIDEGLELHKDEFLKYSSIQLKEADISIWNRYNRDIKILENQSAKSDTYFYKNYYDSLSEENEPFRELYTPISIEGKPYTLSVRANMVESEDLIISIFIIFIFLLSFLLLGLFFINKRLSAKLWKPFYLTLEKIEMFEIDKTNQPQLTKTNIEEFNRLNQSIEKLIEKNTTIYRNQREFVENAAHELQTPLAVFQAKIDTLIQRSDVSEEQSVILCSLNESVSRLNRLNKNLLLLSKIENEIYSSIEPICINEIIEKQLVFFTEQALSKGISLKTELSKRLIIQSNQTLAEILISNLFMNAIKHNIKNGQVWIKLTENSIVFSNTGIPQSLNREKLFLRFSKTNPLEKGNGLGLAIVKKITEINQWSVFYSFTENIHSFSLIF